MSSRVATDVPREPVEAIRNYGLHALDVGYVQAVFDTFGIETIGTTLGTIVHRGERAEISDSLSFLEDTIRFAMHREFAHWYVRSPLLQAVRDMVCGPDALGRHLAMYTMARGGPAANGRVLADAVPWYLEHDPLGLSDLLYNLHIFGRRYRRADYDFVRAMVGHHHYLTRWSAVGLLSTSTKVNLPPNQTRQFLRILAQDQNPRVRTEARWVLDDQRSARTESRPHWGRAAFTSRMLQGEPYPSFWIVQLRVSSYLYVSGEIDYAPPLVEALVQHLSEHPIATEYDPEAYWRAFQTAPSNNL